MSACREIITRLLRGCRIATSAQADLLNDSANSGPSHPVYFRLIEAQLSNKKTVSIAVGAGGRLVDRCLLVTVHNQLSGFGGETVVSSRPAASSTTSGPGFVLEGFRGVDYLRLQVLFEVDWGSFELAAAPPSCCIIVCFTTSACATQITSNPIPL